MNYSCSSSSETLSTLKFAQRAKLIQNNVILFSILRMPEFAKIGGILLLTFGSSSIYARPK